MKAFLVLAEIPGRGSQFDLSPWLPGGVFVLVDLCFRHVDSRLHQGILNAYC